MALLLSLSSNVFGYTDPDYPYTVSSGCRDVCYQDDYNFCKNNCTSYVAYMLNLYGVDFNNGYLGASWGNGGHWDNAARDAGIVVDDHPLPGDVAYWNTLGGVGHVAWVEKVYFDSNGNATNIDVTEYNYCGEGCAWGQRLNLPANNPDGYIHILAYNEGVTGTHYIDCDETYDLCNNQTQQEWGWILQRVADYRCKTCSGQNMTYVNSFFDGMGMGGGGGGAKPDFVINDIWLSDSSGNEKTVFKPGQSMQVHIKVKNAGASTSSGIDIDYFRSNGYHEDSDPTNVGTDFIHKDDLEGGETHEELKNITAPMTQGTYNITAHADAGHDVDEEHESNNDSDEAVFRVDNFGWLVPIINQMLR